MKATILFLLLFAWGPRPGPIDEPGETPGEYFERADTIAESVDSVATTPAEAAAILATMRAESGFDALVHAGLPHWAPWMHEDRGRSKGLAQIHRAALRDEWGISWESLTGTSLEATTRCARATLLILKRNARHCGATLETADGFAKASRLYLTGRSCDPCKASRDRAAEYLRIVARLRAGGAA